MDLISVIMPFYKKKLYFEDSLLSVLDQTYKNLEIIIIYDDVSHDDLFFIKNIIKRDNRIKLIDNKNNYGVAKARNIGLSKSSGKYIAFLDCDDVWFKDKISEQYQLMKMKNLQFSHTSYQIIDKNNLVLGTMNVKEKLTYQDLLNSCDIGLSTVMFKRELLEISDFKDLSTKEDYALWLEYSRKNVEIFGINKLMASWRKLDKGLSSSIMNKFINAFKVYYKFEKKNLFISFFLVINLGVFYIKKIIKQKS